MEQILANALSSIRVGLEDHRAAIANANDARFTSAVRNIYAGILLLAKAKLYQLSAPDGLLIREVRPKLVDGVVRIEKSGRGTIDYKEIKRRFAECDLTLDWNKVERMREIRNDLEHFYFRGRRSQVEEALADAAVTIPPLLDMLGLDPTIDIGDPWWGILLQNRQVFENALRDCQASFSAINWFNETAKLAADHFECHHCGSKLVAQRDASNPDQDDMELTCRACGDELELTIAWPAAVLRLHFTDAYLAATRGGEPPIGKCPQCKNDTLAIEAGECALCPPQEAVR